MGSLTIRTRRSQLQVSGRTTLIGEAVVALRAEAERHERVADFLKKGDSSQQVIEVQKFRAAYLRDIADGLMRKSQEGKIKEI